MLQFVLQEMCDSGDRRKLELGVRYRLEPGTFDRFEFTLDWSHKIAVSAYSEFLSGGRLILRRKEREILHGLLPAVGKRLNIESLYTRFWWEREDLRIRIGESQNVDGLIVFYG